MEEVPRLRVLFIVSILLAVFWLNPAADQRTDLPSREIVWSGEQHLRLTDMKNSWSTAGDCLFISADGHFVIEELTIRAAWIPVHPAAAELEISAWGGAVLASNLTSPFEITLTNLTQEMQRQPGNDRYAPPPNLLVRLLIPFEPLDVHRIEQPVRVELLGRASVPVIADMQSCAWGDLYGGPGITY